MRVKVTQGHISEGRHGDIHSCPVALALKDAGVFHPIVRKRDFLGKDWTPFPENVVEWIDRYDKTGEGEPFEFEV